MEGAGPSPRIVPHDPGWAEQARHEAERIGAALGGGMLALHHIGSTAIPGILAKPIIDLLGVTGRLEDTDAVSFRLEALGYEAMGAFGIAGRRYFRRCTDGRRTNHLHVFRAGSHHAARHLAFRDYLRAHPEVAAEYSALKAKLATRPGSTPDGYADGKAPFIAAVETRALEWWRARGPAA